MYTATLKGDQPAAFQTITSRVLAGEEVTKLVGYAGTGKTYLVAKVAEFLRDRGYQVEVAAPTHKAAGVLEEKLEGFEVKTIHSLLGLRLEHDMEDDTGGRILKAGDPKIKRGTVVICDEASMIGEDLQKQIRAMPAVQWIFVGDSAQLPPVGEKKSDLLNNPDAVLSTVLRQEADSMILEMATAIRNGDMSLSQLGRDVQAVRDADALFNAALTAFQSAEYQADAAHARMLVFRNKRREAINQAMRTLIVGADDPYAPGEWLVMYSQYSITQAEMNDLAERARKASGRTRSRLWREFFELKESVPKVLHVSEEIRVHSAVETTKEAAGHVFRCWLLDVTAHGESHRLYVLDKAERPRWDEVRAALRQKALDLREEMKRLDGAARDNTDKERRRTWGLYFELENTFAWVDYAYAMTVHKSQGSTFTHAFVDAEDIYRSGGMRQSLLYTATTRPSNSLTLYSNGNTSYDPRRHAQGEGDGVRSPHLAI